MRVIYLRQSTASQEVLLGPFLDDTDGKTAETGLTVANTDIKVWKRGGTSEVSKNSGGATHIAAGRYYAVLDATDTNTLGELELNVHVSGALPVKLRATVLHANVFDVLFGSAAPSTYAGGDTSGTTTLLSRVGGALTITSGRVNADLTHIAAAAVSASTAQLGVNVVNFGGAAGTFSSGRPEVDASHWGGTAVASANVRANLTQILGTAPTEGGAGRLAGSFTTLLDVASPVLTAASVNQTGDSYARIGGTGSGLTSLAPAATALSTATWTGTRAGYLDNLSAGAVATAAALATVDDFVDTEVAAIKAVTDKLDTAVELDGSVYRFTTNALEQAPSGGGSLTAADVWSHATRVLTAGTNIALAKGTGVTGFNDLDAAVVAGAVWNAATASYGTANTYGALVETNLDAAVTSRMATYTQPTGFLSATFPSVVASTTNITAGTITTVTNLTNAPTSGDLTAAMKASVNAEVDAAIADVRLDELLAADSDIDGAAPPTVGSVFHELMTKTAGAFTYDQATDSLEAVRDRGDAAWVTATGFSTHSAADVWASATRTLSSAANVTSTGGAITVSSGAVTVGTNNDKTGYALAQAFPTNFSALSITGAGLVTLADASLTTAKLGAFALAKGTNITGFNDIAAAAVVSGGAITTSSGAVTTVTGVTNRVTANTDQLAGQAVTAAAGVTFPASVGTSTLTQAQVSGGAYALNSASFAFDAGLDFTAAQKAATLARVTLADTVTTYTGNTPQTGDAYAVVSSGTHGNAAIKGYVDDIGAAGAGLTAVPWNAAWDAEVQSECADALAAYGASTYAGGDTAGTTTLLSRVTGTRAGYLDNLSAGAAALEATAQAVKAKTDNLPADPADQSLLAAAIGAVETDTQDIQGRLPAALVSGRMDASAGALAAGVITDAAFTVPSLTGPASGVVGYIAMLHRRFFGKSTRDATTIKTYADNGSTVLTTQSYTASGADEAVQAAT